MTRPFPRYFMMHEGKLIESDTPFAKVQPRTKQRDQDFARNPKIKTITPAEHSPGAQELPSQNSGKESLFARKPRRRREPVEVRVARIRKKAAVVESFLYEDTRPRFLTRSDCK